MKKPFKFIQIQEAMEQKIHKRYVKSAGYGPGIEIIHGMSAANDAIRKAIISDLKTRAKEARRAVRRATSETRESHVADFIDKLIKDWGN